MPPPASTSDLAPLTSYLASVARSCTHTLLLLLLPPLLLLLLLLPPPPLLLLLMMMMHSWLQ